MDPGWKKFLTTTLLKSYIFVKKITSVNSISGDRVGVQHVRGRRGRGLRREHQEVQPQLRVRLLHRGPPTGHPHRQRAQEDHQVHRGTEDDQARLERRMCSCFTSVCVRVADPHSFHPDPDPAF